MRFGMKYVEETLGVTRKAILCYQRKGLLHISTTENGQLNYRRFDEEDLDLLWMIKMLRNIGFSLDQIDRLKDSETDFFEILDCKITELEAKQIELKESLGFAKAIQYLRVVPSLEKGEDLKALRKRWNVYSDERTAVLIDGVEAAQRIRDGAYSTEDIERIEKVMSWEEKVEDTEHNYTILAYYKIIAGMKALDYYSEGVQNVVGQLYEYSRRSSNNNMSKASFVRLVIPSYCEGGPLTEHNYELYGVDGTEFIKKALTYFGGFDQVNP